MRRALYNSGAEGPRTRYGLVYRSPVINLARKSDVVVLCLGTNLKVEAEGHDRRDLNLPAAQEQLLEAVYAASPETVLVLMSAGRPPSPGPTITCPPSSTPGTPAKWEASPLRALCSARTIPAATFPTPSTPD